MSYVYWTYAAIVLGCFAVRAIPSVDLRSITSTIAFGPLTFIRPAVVAGGIVWGLAIRPAAPLVIALVLIAMMMMSFRALLNLQFNRLERYRQPTTS